MRSSAAFVPVLLLLVLIAVACVGAALYLLSLGSPPDFGGWLVIIMCFLVGLAPVAMWSSAETYLVPGGRGELRLFEDRVEVWSAGEGTKVFPLTELRIHITRHVARYSVMMIPVASINTDNHLMLQTDEHKVVLSQKLFTAPDAVAHITAAIERIRLGDDLGDEPVDTAAPPDSTPRDEYDDLLDRELEAMD